MRRIHCANMRADNKECRSRRIFSWRSLTAVLHHVLILCGEARVDCRSNWLLWLLLLLLLLLLGGRSDARRQPRRVAGHQLQRQSSEPVRQRLQEDVAGKTPLQAADQHRTRLHEYSEAPLCGHFVRLASRANGVAERQA